MPVCQESAILNSPLSLGEEYNVSVSWFFLEFFRMLPFSVYNWEWVIGTGRRDCVPVFHSALFSRGSLSFNLRQLTNPKMIRQVK
jgi:hypothetical protein